MHATEETIRIDVAQCLAGQLARADRMLAVCETLADCNDSDCVLAVVAASRLLRSDAQLGLSIARMIQLETRHRSIIERPELNSEKIDPLSNESALEKLKYKIERLAAEYGTAE